MENYLENHKKYNKLLFKYLGYSEKEMDYGIFAPDKSIGGFEILRWVMHKINCNPKDGYKMKIIVSVKEEETDVVIQEWYDTSRLDGYVNVVSHKEICNLKKEETEKKIYENEIINVSHRAVYNACVDFIIKTS